MVGTSNQSVPEMAVEFWIPLLKKVIGFAHEILHQSYVQLFVQPAMMNQLPVVPSGKQPHNYGKSQVLMGKSTINGHFP
jgi:hypothetical protein